MLRGRGKEALHCHARVHKCTHAQTQWQLLSSGSSAHTEAGEACSLAARASRNLTETLSGAEGQSRSMFTHKK